MKKLRFIDCGANIGQSIEWALKVFKDYEVIVNSFEPLPLNFNIIKEKFSQEDRIVVQQFAVSTHYGNSTFYCQNTGARTGSTLVKGKLYLNENESIQVETIDLADWIKKNVSKDELTILKIDVEGAEYELLPHLLENNIQDLIDYWLIEYHSRKIPISSDVAQQVELNVMNSVKHVFDWSRPDIVEGLLTKTIEMKDWLDT